MPLEGKNLDTPDETIELPMLIEKVVEIGGFTVGLETVAPGWRWSEHTKPVVGGDWCEAHHVGVTLSGRWGVLMRDGQTIEFGPDDAFDVPAGHDSWTIGDDPCVTLNWSGLRTFFASKALLPERFLAAILFTDLVDSTAKASSLGHATWSDLLAHHQQMIRECVATAHGRVIKLTGDGVLAIFEAPAGALRAAGDIRGRSAGQDLSIRAGVHVGQVESSGEDVLGVAVHEAARVMAAADPGEILASESARILSLGDGLTFIDRGEHLLKGLEGPRRLYSVDLRQ